MKDAADPSPLARMRPLFEELGELKRADFQGRSIAARGFTDAWRALTGGADPMAVARSQVRHALASVVMGGIDADVLRDAGLSPARVAEILDGAIVQKTDALDPSVAGRLGERGALPQGDEPAFCALLEGAPRAGATAPGLPRLVLRPAENHAEHCWTVAVYGALIALSNRADDAIVGRAFLIGLAHHFPNAWLPDAGFAGEIALGASLDPVFAAFTARALGQLPDGLAAATRDALAVKDDADDPAGAAFVAGDVIDRVLELRYYERAYSFRLADALGPMELVHAGPLQDFQNQVLVEAGIVL